MNFLEQIADYENVESAFHSCMKGKRGKLSPQLAYLNADEYLLRLRSEILRGENFRWGKYKEFYVVDPKYRKISSAPFVDRVAHRAMYNILDPVLDTALVDSTFACRSFKGNGRAVRCLYQMLQNIDQYWAVKVDVSKYFASISHGRLMGKLFSFLSDESVSGLIKGLLTNHPGYQNGRGLPLGNLTSQIFANFYLSDLDHEMMDFVGGRYIRYMDDILMLLPSHRLAREAMNKIISIGHREKLRFPSRKRLLIGCNQPIPFLGFSVTKDKVHPLNRNKRRIRQKLFRKRRLPASEYAQSVLSYEAWREFPLRVSENRYEEH